MTKSIEIDENVSLRFGCKGCGRCCGSPPQMSVREALSLVDDFPMLASLVSVPYGVTLRGRHAENAAMTRERSESLGGYVSGGYDGAGNYRNFVTTLSASALYPESLRRCPALQGDGKCGIYDRRPSVCRYVPAQHLFHREKQNRAIEIFYSYHAEDCDWSSAAPVVLDRGRIIDTVMASALDKAEEDDRRDGQLLRILVDDDRAVGTPDGELSIRDLIETSMQSPSFEFPLIITVMFLETLRREGDLPEGYGDYDIQNVAVRQAAACERMIQENLRRKNKDDRALTERLRALKQVNEMVARADI